MFSIWNPTVSVWIYFRSLHFKGNLFFFWKTGLIESELMNLCVDVHQQGKVRTCTVIVIKFPLNVTRDSILQKNILYSVYDDIRTKDCNDMFNYIPCL